MCVPAKRCSNTPYLFLNVKNELWPSTFGSRNPNWEYTSNGELPTTVPVRMRLYLAKAPSLSAFLVRLAPGVLMRCDSSSTITA